MRVAVLIGLLVLVGCGGAPQPERNRLAVHAVSGTDRSAGFDTGLVRHRRSGGQAVYEYNNGQGLLFGASFAAQRQRGFDSDDEATLTAFGVSTGRINRRSGIEAGLVLYAGATNRTLPWLRFMLGNMPDFRIGVTFGPDQPLVAVHVAHLHVRFLMEALELQIGIANAGRIVQQEDFDGEELPVANNGDDDGPVLTAELRWKLPHLGLDAGFMTGAFDVARLGVFFDFE